MTEHRVSLDYLADVVEQMARWEQTVEQAMADAQAQVQRLHVSWEGGAADAQLAAHRKWLDGARRMREGLATMRSIASDAHGNYSAAVATNTAMWQL